MELLYHHISRYNDIKYHDYNMCKNLYVYHDNRYMAHHYCDDLYNCYIMARRDLPDIYALARGHGNIYQANPDWPYIALWSGLYVIYNSVVSFDLRCQSTLYILRHTVVCCAAQEAGTPHP